MFFCRIIVLILFLSPLQGHAKTNVLFINPGLPEESFWGSVDGYISEAAKQLDIKLEIYHARRDHINAIDFLTRRLTVTPLPDYIVLVNEKGIGAKMLDTVRGFPIFVTFVLNDLSEIDKRQAYKDAHWQTFLLPGLFPDNEYIGRETAAALFEAGGEVPAEVAVISGDKTTPASQQRELGAMTFIQHNIEMAFTQRVFGHWREENAYRQSKALIARYGELRYVWTANDHMAFGVQQAAVDMGLVVGEDIFISTVNTSKRVLLELKAGKIAALGGGHFVAPGLVLTKISKHVDQGYWSKTDRLPLFEIIEPNSELHAILLSEEWQRIDFPHLDVEAVPFSAFKQAE
ncbi:ABC transporter substrate-binding protein [Thaumasiovibrio subtropicus]|uniref:ABC transporter substrate-binding protein n=1 Tax=Thaumasiovibrio subtropicus TaxID=1891207 RepID=UPI000B357A36|nr:ABC transporter substrate-binding protein [Thaumasiovibrio subtropicus]